MLSVCFDNIRELEGKSAGLGKEQELGHIGLPQRESKPASDPRRGGVGGRGFTVGRQDRESLRVQCRAQRSVLGEGKLWIWIPSLLYC